MKITPSQAPVLTTMPSESTKDTRPGFKEALVDSINKVNDLQFKAHEAMDDLATGKSSNIHETMIAIQKAEVSFKMMMQVRNKIISVYQEVMRMQA